MIIQMKLLNLLQTKRLTKFAFEIDSFNLFRHTTSKPLPERTLGPGDS